MISRIQIAHRRIRGQHGQAEAIMFSLLALFIYTPLFLFMYVTGMGLIYSIQVQTLARDMDNMYIHGTDFSSYNAQLLTQQIAGGLNLQFPNIGAGNNAATNTGTAGNGIIWVSQIMYIGSATQTMCESVAPATCTNANSFVFTQQIIFGNSSLTSQKNTTLGSPTGATLSTSGVVSNFITDSHAALGAAAQTAMDNLWQTTTNGQADLIDGQVVYVVESYFQTPQLNMGNYNIGSALNYNFNSPGVYARYFF